MMEFKQISKELGCEVTSEAQANAILNSFTKALKDLVKFGLALSDDEILPHQSAPYLETLVSKWNKVFYDFNLNYSLQIREFNNVTSFVFSDYTTNTMLSGSNMVDLFKPAQLVKIVAELNTQKNKMQSATDNLYNRKGYGVMKRKDFAGDPLHSPEYLGEHVYRGTVKGGYLIDTVGKRHSLNSRYVTGFKFFTSEALMKKFNF